LGDPKPRALTCWPISTPFPPPGRPAEWRTPAATMPRRRSWPRFLKPWRRPDSRSDRG
jgi:hypothetical protein